MLIPEIVSVARKRAEVALRKRVREFAAIADGIVVSAVDRGMLRSGVTQRQIGEAIRSEYEIRALELWDILVELGAHEAEVSHAQLLGLVAEILDAGVADLERQRARAAGLVTTAQPTIRSMAGYREEALEAVEAQIDTALLKLGARDARPRPTKETTLFIGSSSAGKAQAKALVTALARPGLTFVPWWDAFAPGRVLLAELDAIREEVDGALLLFTPESKTTIRRKSVQIPNLNVLFEFGYFYGHFGPSRVGMIRYGDIYLPSDFGGYIYISGSSKFRRAKSVAIAPRTVNDFGRWVDRLGT